MRIIRPLLRAAPALAGALALCAAAAHAQPAAPPPGTIVLTITDASTGQVVQGARVDTDVVAFSYRSDAAGQVRLRDVAPGKHTLGIRMAGFTPGKAEVEVAAGQTVSVAVSLVRDAVALDPLRVEGRSQRLQAFYERRENAASGYFVTRDEIERRRPRRFNDIFRGVPNARVVTDPASGRATLLIGRSIDQRNCPPQYYLDGMPIQGFNLDQMLRPETIEGVEVYSGAQVPPGVRASNAACGVIMIWTRDGSG